MAESGQYELGEPGWNNVGNSYQNYSSYSTLSYHQQEKLQEMTKKIKDQFDFLEEDEIQEKIIEFNFDAQKIDNHFQIYAVDSKYEGLEAYEWKQTEKKEFVNKKRGKGRGRGRGRGRGSHRGQRQYDNQYNNHSGTAEISLI